ncbi:Zn-dependent protease (includes SpoIVFB) [Yoonia tamlensis]|uniref:Zn-dependent protease (Includes SpoIVFB) n=1 Tax=Yoonia tamlensis TaxID=390270 RepID=A0A1I6FUS9_9RHOB|nr:site-2 protease family protein [Yoonia tamlensis]SFR33671.1 Zn-dependent protease (includes SpoIVFB) [Yoonia tamlensis]
MFGNDTVVFQFTGPFGVRVEIGQSLAMLVLFIGLMSGGNIIDGLIFAVMLVTAIFLHEMGHAAGCLLQKVPVRRVMLHGGGGFCEPARSTTRRESELIVALGPLVNLALWALASLAFKAILMGNLYYSPLMMTLAGYLAMFAFLNLALFFFNMMPVQPLDGGKLLHLGLLRVLSQAKAHRTTGAIGLVVALAWIPAMIIVYVNFHWVLFFMPSIIGHYRMAKGQLA